MIINLSMIDIDLKKIQFKDGLIPAIIQNNYTSRVLMLAYMNKQALERTLSTGQVWFYSRSRNKLWKKGEESGHFLNLVNILVDCDQDTLLVKVNSIGPTCHRNTETCFDKIEKKNKVDVGLIGELYNLLEKRKVEMPKDSYTSFLFTQGLEKICAKIEEESEEVCRAARQETKQRVVEESVDVFYHLLVLLLQKDISLPDFLEEISRRRK